MKYTKYILRKGDIQIVLSKKYNKWNYETFNLSESLGIFEFTEDMLNDILTDLLTDLQNNNYGLRYIASEPVFVGKFPY